MKKIYLVVPIVGLMATASYAAMTAEQPYAQDNVGPNTKQYHSYDGLICTDCHTLHNSEGGVAIGETGYTGTANRELLKRGDWTDMCLSCHQEGHNTASTANLEGVETDTNGGWVAPVVMTVASAGNYTAGSMPAGDFYWSNLYPSRGHNPAYTKGSMGTATSKLMTADPLGVTPPGSVGVEGITDSEWSCHSCHGMHARFSGSYTAYRQLKRKVNGIVIAGCIDTRAAGADSTYQDCETSIGNTATGYEAITSNSRGSYDSTLNYVATRADGTANDGASLWTVESDTNKNVYRGGFSSFCAACHGDFHGGTVGGSSEETRTTNNAKTRVGGTWVRHPTNVKMNEAGSKYGMTTYNKAITVQSGTNPNPVGYDWRYPLVQPTGSTAVKATVGSWTDSTTALGDSRIMCLTCHKAHASKFDNMTRWDTNAHSFLAKDEVDFAGVAQAGDNPAYGCGKCHQKGGVKAFKKM